ncbi:MAG: lytic transglycosylase domain-containing protein [Synergistaceae bacterium]|nr:lytic transglycosylase domain-containing protein [Synergistaceae bacterium]
MHKSTSVYPVSFSTLTEFFHARKRSFIIILLALFVVAISITPYVSSLICERAAKNWSDGWRAWRDGDAETALYCWTKDSIAAGLAPRPARLCYWRIRALDKLGRHDEAYALRRRMTQKYPLDFYTFLLFPDGGMSFYPRETSIKTAALFHPRPWSKEVASASRLTGVPENMIWAVMKRESKFRINAKSQSGAIGLMQLMPTTARDEAKLLKVNIPDICIPRYNILLGANHFAGLEEKFHGEILRAIAAYNAGSASVVRWDTLSAHDWAEWVEEIPYAETREFVRSVLENREVYRLSYDSDDKRSLFFLARGKPSPLGSIVASDKNQRDR